MTMIEMCEWYTRTTCINGWINVCGEWIEKQNEQKKIEK